MGILCVVYLIVHLCCDSECEPLWVCHVPLLNGLPPIVFRCRLPCLSSSFSLNPGAQWTSCSLLWKCFQDLLLHKIKGLASCLVVSACAAWASKESCSLCSIKSSFQTALAGNWRNWSRSSHSFGKICWGGGVKVHSAECLHCCNAVHHYQTRVVIKKKTHFLFFSIMLICGGCLPVWAANTSSCIDPHFLSTLRLICISAALTVRLLTIVMIQLWAFLLLFFVFGIGPLCCRLVTVAVLFIECVFGVLLYVFAWSMIFFNVCYIQKHKQQEKKH